MESESHVKVVTYPRPCGPGTPGLRVCKWTSFCFTLCISEFAELLFESSWPLVNSEGKRSGASVIYRSGVKDALTPLYHLSPSTRHRCMIKGLYGLSLFPVNLPKKGSIGHGVTQLFSLHCCQPVSESQSNDKLLCLTLP